MELLELLAIVILLVAKPFSWAKLSCMFGLRSILIIIQTWIELLRAAISFQLNLFWRIIIWAIAVLSLPIRALSALQREKMLEMRLHAMQIELENLVWTRSKLGERLQGAIKERRLIEALLVELEDDHDEAISKIELLESELQYQKIENQRLKEVHGKALCSYRFQNAGDQEKILDRKDTDQCRIPLLKSSSDEASGCITGQEMRFLEEDGSKNQAEMHEARKVLKAGGPVQPYTHDPLSWGGLDKNDILERKWKHALSRSFFSATLSLSVGIVVWEARDPCMPLIVALFVVAVMAVANVVEFYLSMKNKPAVGAIALLSFNCFVLGILTYPVLPVVVHALAPVVSRGLGRVGMWQLGFPV